MSHAHPPITTTPLTQESALAGLQHQKQASYIYMIRGCLLVLVLLFSQQAAAQDIESLKTAKPFSINGSIGLSSTFYTANGIENRQTPFTYGINANLNLSLYGVLQLPFSFVWYNQQQASYNYPSFNRYGISPKYKWITVHLGHRSMRLSEYTLNGYAFLGAGVELTPGKFRFAAMYGKFNQNSDVDPYMADSIPQYTRRGWAVKAGYGTPQRFIDVSVLRIGDDTKNYVQPTNPEAPTPAQNLAVGLTSNFAITPKLLFAFDGSISLYTKNIKDPIQVMVEGQGMDFLQKLITINLTSTYYTAFKTSLVYKVSRQLGFGLEYRRIDPEYQSLGAYFSNNDLEMYSFNANAALWKNKLVLNGSLGVQRDNLGNTKKATSRRTVGSLSGSLNMTQSLGVDFNYSNFSTNQRAGRSPLIDSLRLFQVNHNISVMPRFTKVTAANSHFVMLSLNRMQLDDKNKKTATQSETATTMLSANYMLGFLKSGTSLSLGLNYTTLENNVYKGKMYGGSLGAAQTLLKNKLSLNWTNSFTLNNVDENDSKTLTSYLSVNYRPHPRHSLNLGVNYISNSYSNTEQTPSYNETRGEFRYGYSF
jgi:hypothetical protein